MQIKYMDDGKGKHQSVTATAIHTHADSSGWCDVYLEGLGPTEEETKVALLNVVQDVLRWIDVKP